MARDEHKVLIPANPDAASSKPVPSEQELASPHANTEHSPASLPGVTPEMPKAVPVTSTSPAQKHVPAQTQPQHATHANQNKDEEEDDSKTILGKIKNFIKQSERVLAVTHKPGESEFRRIAISTGIGMAVLGLTGLFVSLLGNALRTV